MEINHTSSVRLLSRFHFHSFNLKVSRVYLPSTSFHFLELAGELRISRNNDILFSLDFQLELFVETLRHPRLTSISFSLLILFSTVSTIWRSRSRENHRQERELKKRDSRVILEK